MSLPQYQHYKASGIKWLGEVPAHWVVAPIKRGFEVCLGKMLQTDASSTEDALMPYLRAANIQWGRVDLSDLKQMWFSSRERQSLRLEAGDLLVSEGGDVGRSAIWRQELDECYIQNSINRVRAKRGFSTGFLYYWMVTIKAKGYVDVLCNKSTIAHFTAEKVAAVPTPFPPEPEQHAIAAFLDRETSKIDSLIEQQEKLITLVAEKRQATISHAVTRGLDPNVPMKDSGSEWLGQVPAHWQLIQLKHLCSLLKDGTHLPPPRVEEGVPLLSVRNIDESLFALRDDDSKITQKDFQELSRAFVPKKGDVLLAIVGATLGKVAIVPDGIGPFHIQRSLAIFRPKPVLSPQWLFYSFSSNAFQRLLWQNVGFSAQPGIYLGTLQDFKVPVTSLEEQAEIVGFVAAESSKLDALEAEARRSIALLKERRIALVAAAVTGQVDVRGITMEHAEEAALAA